MKPGEDPGQALFEKIGHSRAQRYGMIARGFKKVIEDDHRLNAAGHIDVHGPNSNRFFVNHFGHAA